MPPKPGAERQWRRLLLAAQEEVDATLAALPRPVQREARRLPVTMEPKPSPAMIKDGIAPDLLGLFIGEAFPDAESGAHTLPAQVLLFLENLWEYADHDPVAYREEVRRTLLHELGHYLGLNEDDLERRDLD
jgi:predicted Zn-dependent protease with MMP-like domain